MYRLNRYFYSPINMVQYNKGGQSMAIYSKSFYREGSLVTVEIHKIPLLKEGGVYYKCLEYNTKTYIPNILFVCYNLKSALVLAGTFCN